jgi:hypothetical protein
VVSVKEDAAMGTEIRFRWLLVASIAVLAVAGAWLLRGWFLDSTRARLTQSYQQRLMLLPERDAARLVQRLAQDQDQWLEILIWASADDRPLVGTTAQRELQDRIDQWASLPLQNSADRAVRLARLLAVYAPSTPPERRHFAHSIAQRLILWPVDGRHLDTASLIADCESVLMLPRADQVEIRVAAAPEVREAAPPTLVQATPEPPLPQPMPETAAQTPTTEPPPHRIESSFAEPRPFTAAPGLRIPDR